MADKQQNGQDKEILTGAAAEAPERITINTELDPVFASLLQTDVEAALRFVENGDFFSKTIEAMNTTKERLSKVFAALQQAIISGDSTHENVMNWFSAFRDSLQIIKPLLDELEELRPYLEIEFQKPEYDGLTMGDLMEGSTDADGNPVEGSLWNKALAAAREARERDIAQKATVKRADKIEYPLDKINSRIWNLLERDTNGQITFSAEKRGSKKQLDILYSIDFEELESSGIKITKRLLPFDKRVYIAVSALFNAGNNVITMTQIHYAMGNTTRPKGEQLTKIKNSVYKMTGARISVDNTSEAATYKRYGKFVYSGSLLPIETVERYNVQGAFTDAAIHIFREPPLVSFAKQRQQITTVSVKLLQSPVSKTDTNLMIDDYLIERISRAKTGKGQHKILYKTLYDHAGIKPGKPQQRTPEKVRRYLDHYKSCGTISGYKEESDGVTVYFRTESR